jgi:hypothetical protein
MVYNEVGSKVGEEDYLRDMADSLDELCTMMRELIDLLRTRI